MDSELIFQCPVCKHHNHKLYVNVDKGLFNCFHCSFSGDIRKLQNYDYIWGSISDSISLSTFNNLSNINRVQKIISESELLKPLQPLRSIEPTDKQYSYLLNRGMDEDSMDCYDILVSDNKKYSDRVFITISNSDGETIFYTGRTILDNCLPKYLNSITKKTFVFKSSTPVDSFYTEDAYICEGIFDAFKLPGGIALLGKTLSRDQHKALFSILKQKKNIYLCLDPGTVRESKTLALELDSWFPTKNIFILNWNKNETLDLGDLSKVLSRVDLLRFISDNSVQFSTKILSN